MRRLGNQPVLGWVLRALQESGVCDPVVVATSSRPDDQPVVDFARSQGADVVRGDVDDVLGRFLAVLDAHPAQAVVRVTADCPFLDPAIIAMCCRAFDPAHVDYLSTVTPRSLPHGLDVEVASPTALRLAARHATGVDRTHVTSYLYRQPGRFRVAGLTFAPAHDDLRVTLDTAEDARLLDAVVEALGDRIISKDELVRFLRNHPEIVDLNAGVRQKAIEEG